IENSARVETEKNERREEFEEVLYKHSCNRSRVSRWGMARV
ncbi:hypothetical protein CSUI_007695, partial [Cystoisospora suis]